MRDSALKRTLVSAYFSAIEVRRALAGAWRPAPYPAERLDYDRYWTRRDPGSLHPRFTIIAAHVRPGEAVLDVGCGDGALLEHLAARGAGPSVGLDLSATAVARARGRGVDARCVRLDAFRAEDGRVFDHVVLSEVIEHVVDPEGLIADAWGLTRRTLWVTFPNIAYFPHRLRMLAGRFPVQWAVYPSEHVRFWSVRDFPWWLARLGLPAPAIVPSNGVTLGGLHRWWPNLWANQVVVRLSR